MSDCFIIGLYEVYKTRVILLAGKNIQLMHYLKSTLNVFFGISCSNYPHDITDINGEKSRIVSKFRSYATSMRMTSKLAGVTLKQ